MKQLPLYALTLLLGVPLMAAPAQKPAAKPATKPAAKPKPTPRPTAKPKPTARPILPTPTPTPEPEPVAEVGPKTWAVLVGVSQYQNTQISGLHYPAKDAIGLRDALTNPALGGIPANRILLLTDENATRDKIMGAVDSFLRPNVQEGDKVIVFLAGHGIAKGAGLEAKSYLLPTDVKGLTTAALEATAVPLRPLADSLGTLPAAQFVVFVDACREDPTPGRGVKAEPRSDVMSRGITVTPSKPDAESATFFACSVGQRAFEDEKYGHGVFTKWILDGIKEGNIAQKPSGAINMGNLASFVSTKVDSWAKEVTASGNFEVEQTPELVTTQINKPIVLINRKSGLSDELFPAAAPRLLVDAPEGAQVSINGVRAGVGQVEKAVPSEGDYTINVTKVGYAPVSRSVKALGGYEHQVFVQMEPVAGATGGMGAVGAASPAADLYKRALEAQQSEQWEVAEQGFSAAIAADPKYSAAYEALYDLHVMQNRNTNALADALGLFGSTAPSAHTLSFLSRAYSQFATKGAGASSTMQIKAVGKYGAPKDVQDAAKIAINAAKEAVALNANLPEAQLAQGYALAALDTDGKRKDNALAAFGKAVMLDGNNPATQLGMGYGIRFYATKMKSQDKQKAEVNRAITTLNEAVKLRPNYYEAHRELAFCQMVLENTDAALKECSLARANRGNAGDVNEIAGIEVAMGGLYKKIADSSTGDQKAANEAASQGYLEEAQETSSSKDLQTAISILNAAGVGLSLRNFLPAKLLPLLDVRGAINGKIDNAINDKIPGGGRIPGVPGLKIPKF